MVQIPTVTEDPKLLALNRPSEASGELQPVKQLEQPAAPSSVTEMREHRQREYEERRQGKQRRKKRRPVLLDTRNQHDRRSSDRRDKDREQPLTEEGKPPRRGIDVKA
jgi:hypothetical protein